MLSHGAAHTAEAPSRPIAPAASIERLARHATPLGTYLPEVRGDENVGDATGLQVGADEVRQVPPRPTRQVPLMTLRSIADRAAHCTSASSDACSGGAGRLQRCVRAATAPPQCNDAGLAAGTWVAKFAGQTLEQTSRTHRFLLAGRRGSTQPPSRPCSNARCRHMTPRWACEGEQEPSLPRDVDSEPVQPLSSLRVLARRRICMQSTVAVKTHLPLQMLYQGR